MKYFEVCLELIPEFWDVVPATLNCREKGQRIKPDTLEKSLGAGANQSSCVYPTQKSHLAICYNYWSFLQQFQGYKPEEQRNIRHTNFVSTGESRITFKQLESDTKWTIPKLKLILEPAPRVALPGRIWAPWPILGKTRSSQTHYK